MAVYLHCLYMYAIFACMHALFYFQLIEFYLNELNTYLSGRLISLSSHASQSTKFSDMLSTSIYLIGGEKKKYQPDIFLVIRTLKTIKIIHFRIWNAVQDINAIFGWFLIAFMFKNYVDSLWEVYWLLLFFHGYFKPVFQHFVNRFGICSM